MNLSRIKKLQKLHGFDGIQAMINDGSAWKMEGSFGREASALLESGVCMLPTTPKYDVYGNRVPSRYDLKEGTKGTYLNSKNFWTSVESGKSEIDEFAEIED
jgi:hypothetical protein